MSILVGGLVSGDGRRANFSAIFYEILPLYDYFEQSLHDILSLVHHFAAREQPYEVVTVDLLAAGAYVAAHVLEVLQPRVHLPLFNQPEHVHCRSQRVHPQ